MWYDLVPDVLNVIMLILIDINPEGATLLASTCKAEFKRYLRLVPIEKRLTFREIVLNKSDDEDPVWDSRRDRWLLPDDKGYNYFHEKRENQWISIKRSEGRHEQRERKKYLDKEKRQMKTMWNKGNYDF